jgi:hypothetical protein
MLGGEVQQHREARPPVAVPQRNRVGEKVEDRRMAIGDGAFRPIGAGIDLGTQQVVNSQAKRCWGRAGNSSRDRSPDVTDSCVRDGQA